MTKSDKVVQCILPNDHEGPCAPALVASAAPTEEWIKKVAAEIHELNPDYLGFEDEVVKLILAARPGYVVASAAPPKHPVNGLNSYKIPNVRGPLDVVASAAPQEDSSGSQEAATRKGADPLAGEQATPDLPVTQTRRGGQHGHQQSLQASEAASGQIRIQAASSVDQGAHGQHSSQAAGWDARGDRETEIVDMCQGCGGVYRFDTTISSAVWNVVIRAAGLPEYLCLACIVAAFVKADQSFCATLYGAPFDRLPRPPVIEVRVNSQPPRDAAMVSEENNALRIRIRELELAAPPVLAAESDDLDKRVHVPPRTVMAYRPVATPVRAQPRPFVDEDAPVLAQEEKFHEPQEGHRIIRVYRDGSWREITPAGWEKRYSWPDAEAPVLAAPPQEQTPTPCLHSYYSNGACVDCGFPRFSERKMFTPLDLDAQTKPLHAEIERLRAALAAPPPREDELDLGPIKVREAAATTGPWTPKLQVEETDPNLHDEWLVIFEPLVGNTWQDDSSLLNKVDAKFIAHARQDIPALVAEVERLRSALARLAAPSSQEPTP